MSTTNRHQCPAAGCTTMLPMDRMFCWPHWRRVPRPLQRDVWRLWNNGHVEDGYWDVRQAAIDAVNGRVAV